jgi:hypothetical protein
MAAQNPHTPSVKIVLEYEIFPSILALNAFVSWFLEGT